MPSQPRGTDPGDRPHSLPRMVEFAMKQQSRSHKPAPKKPSAPKPAVKAKPPAKPAAKPRTHEASAPRRSSSTPQVTNHDHKMLEQHQKHAKRVEHHRAQMDLIEAKLRAK